MNFTLKHLILAGSLGAIATVSLAQVNPNGQPVPPPPGEQLSGPDGLSHFQCYRIMPGPIGHAPVAITTTDQFGKQDIKLGQPVQLCNPTVKYHNKKMFPAVNPKAHLICYQIMQSESKPHTVDTRNQFYKRKYQTGPRTVFCAPSFKTLIGEKEFPLDGS
jgi:hypothetical protein